MNSWRSDAPNEAALDLDLDDLDFETCPVFPFRGILEQQPFSDLTGVSPVQQLLVPQPASFLRELQQPASFGDLVSQAPSSFPVRPEVEQHPEVFPSCKGVSVETDLGPQHPFLGGSITCGMAEQQPEGFKFVEVGVEHVWSVFGSGTFEQQLVLGIGALMAALSGTVQLLDLFLVDEQTVLTFSWDEQQAEDEGKSITFVGLGSFSIPQPASMGLSTLGP
jgi:hypothetical protein